MHVFFFPFVLLINAKSCSNFLHHPLVAVRQQDHHRNRRRLHGHAWMYSHYRAFSPSQLGELGQASAKHELTLTRTSDRTDPKHVHVRCQL